MQPFRIKICGVTTVKEAMRAIESGADAIGLNFYEESKRNVEALTAMDIAATVSTAVTTIGVFVNSPAAGIVELAEHLRLSAVQLHGDEDPSIAHSLDGFNLIKAIRVPELTGDAADDTSDESLDVIVKKVQLEVDRWVSVGTKAILLDAHSSKGFGGTGTAFNWKIASRLDVPIPMVLAGGLNAGNVGDAILGARPDAVDVASGVENQGGGKDLSRMLEFSSAAREAFQKLKLRREEEDEK